MHIINEPKMQWNTQQGNWQFRQQAWIFPTLALSLLLSPALKWFT